MLELLWQWQAGDLDADIEMVISNHEDMRELVESFGIPLPSYSGNAGDEAGSRTAAAGAR